MAVVDARDGLLGAHLARGLHAGTDNDDPTADELEFRDPATGNYLTYKLLDNAGTPTWYYQANPATNAVQPGEGFWVNRGSGSRARTNMVMIAPSRTNASFDIAITTNHMSDGWNWQVVGWPHDKALAVTGQTNALGLESLAHGGTTARVSSDHASFGDQIWVWNE